MSGTTLIVGLALLLLGRRLFWLFVAGGGFAIGALLAVEFLKLKPDVVLAVALGCGVLGALIAMWAQKVAVGLGGFLAGAFLGHAIGGALGGSLPPWACAVIGGILGALLLAALFNWTLIALSSLLGAAIIAQTVPVSPPWPVVVFVGMLCVGLSIQTRQYAGRKASEPAKKSGDK